MSSIGWLHLTEPAAGWPFDSIVQELVANPGMKAADLSQIISRAHPERYQRRGNPHTDGATTQSALRLDKVRPLITAVRNLASAVMKNLNASADRLLLDRLTAQNGEYPEYADLSDSLAQLIWVPVRQFGRREACRCRPERAVGIHDRGQQLSIF